LKYEEVIMYIEHIIWRFVKHQPEKYKLLDVRHNVMKNLILGDCAHLIKFILFGDEKESKEEREKEEREREREREKKRKEKKEELVKHILFGDEHKGKKEDLIKYIL